MNAQHSDLLVIGLIVIVLLLFGALGRSAATMAAVAATAFGCVARIIGVMIVAVILLIALGFAATRTGAAGAPVDGPAATTTVDPAPSPQPGAGPGAGPGPPAPSMPRGVG